MNAGNRRRNVLLKFWVKPEEEAAIRAKMALYGTKNLSAYLRKMAMDGFIINLDFPELNTLSSLLLRSGNNINQIAKRVNATGRMYAEDLAEIKHNQQQLIEAANKIISSLARLP